MRKGLLLLLLFCVAGLLHAQPVVQRTEDLFGVPIPFNPDFIRTEKIKTISAAITLKPDNKVIIDKGLSEGYNFDTLGRLTEYYRTRVRSYDTKEIEHPAVYRKGKRIARPWTEYKYQYTYDTVFTNFYYDSLNRVIIKRVNDGDFYNAWYYRYTNEPYYGCVLAQLQCRESNTGTSHREFRLGMQTILSTEDFCYERLTPNQVKRKCLNDEGKVYKEVILDFDSAGRLLAENSSYVVSWVKQTSFYRYDSLGRLTEKSNHSFSGDELAERTTFLYDSLGRFDMQRNYKNEILQDEISFVYSKETPAFYAMINRRAKDAAIDIVKFTYSFYGDPKKD